jgi:hypothetical protein
MSNTRTIILIWGAAILFYLATVRASGTKTVIGALQNFVSGTTKTLQAR